VPKVHLKWFVDRSNPPYTWVDEKGRPGPRLLSINVVLRRPDYYTLRGDGGARDYVIESGLLHAFETDIAAIFRKLIDRRESLSKEERNLLAWFVASLRVRVPPF